MQSKLLRTARQGDAYVIIGLAVVLILSILGWAIVTAPGLALGLLGLLSIGIVVVLYPQALLLVLIAGFPWESQLAYPSESLTAIAIVRVLLPVILLIRICATKQYLVVPKFLFPLGVFLCLVLLSLMFSVDPGAGIVKTFRYFFFAVSLFAAIQFLGRRSTIIMALRVLTISAAAASISALVGFLSGELTRAAGPIADPNSFGFVLVTVIPLATFLFLNDRRWRAVWAFSLVVLLGATLATLSRGALVGLAGLLIWGIITRRISVVALVASATAICVTVALGFIFFSPVLNERLAGRERGSGSSAAARTVFWRAAVEMAADYPVVGVGPERYDAERERYLRNSPIPLEGHEELGHAEKRRPVRSAHSSYLEIAAEDGLPAAIAFCFFLLGVWTSLHVFLRDPANASDHQGRRLAVALQGALLAALLSGIFISGQLDPPFWLVAVLGGALAGAPEAVHQGRRAPVDSAEPALLQSA